MFTSSFKVAIETSSLLSRAALSCEQVSALRLYPINSGVLEGPSCEEMQSKHPHLLSAWQKTPYTFRFPEANSQQDCAFCLDPLVMELERQDTVLPCVVVLSIYIAGALRYFSGDDDFAPDRFHE